MDEDIIAETPRLILRPWRESDAPALFAYASDSRVSRMAMWAVHESVEMSLAVIREVFMPNPHSFAIVLRSNGRAVGCVGLVPAGSENYPPLPGEMEAGYWLGLPLWGQGLATEALTALIAYCRTRLPQLTSLLITTDARNVASQRVALKCGFAHIADYLCEDIPSRAYRLRL